MMFDRELYKQRMYNIVGAAMTLYNELHSGFAEPIYQECLSIVCTEMGIPWECEKRIAMNFHGMRLKKEYVADFVCYGDIIVELKAVSEILNEHRAQVFNYVRMSGLRAERYLLNTETNKLELIRGQ